MMGDIFHLFGAMLGPARNRMQTFESRHNRKHLSARLTLERNKMGSRKMEFLKNDAPCLDSLTQFRLSSSGEKHMKTRVTQFQNLVS